LRDSVLVVVLAVRGVAVPVVHVIGVVAVRDPHMATALAVGVVVGVVGIVATGFAVVEVTVVRAVEMAVVGVVHVVLVRNGHVTAPLAVDVLVIGVLEMCRGHDRPPSHFACNALTRTSQHRQLNVTTY
jgi:hypothetical protein